MKRILAITGIRSDYDLMSNLYKKINSSNENEIKLLVSGAHLSESYGHTVDLIEKDNLKILLKIESLIDSDSLSSRLKTTSLLLMNSIDVVRDYNPDLIIYAGDREEVIVGAMLGTFLKIPTAHFFGGEFVASGHVDNELRNAASKMSSIHFVSTEENRKRLMNMGEASFRIFKIGSPALDKFFTEKELSMEEIYAKLGIKAFEKYALVIYHALDNSDEYSTCFKSTLDILLKLGIPAFVSYPNSDPGNKKIIKIIDEYKSNKEFYFYKNLDRNTFINIYKNALLQIGNSSCGIEEAATIKIPVVDIGHRQNKRKCNENVIRSNSDYNSIETAINSAIDNKFLDHCKNIVNIYGDGKSTERAYDILNTIDLSKYLLKMEDPNEL